MNWVENDMEPKSHCRENAIRLSKKIGKAEYHFYSDTTNIVGKDIHGTLKQRGAQ